MFQAMNRAPDHATPSTHQDAGAWAERVRRETKTEPVVLKPGEWVDVKAAR
jgi:hypothetical protein